MYKLINGDMMELMKELILAPGVSGGEDKIAEIIERELKDVADTIERDNMGNIIVTKKGSKKAPKIMLDAHMDEIGLMVKYIDDKGLSKVKEHAYDFINQKLKPEVILNDGKQTPMKGHPVFIAQHATGTCCRGCLEKWHHIKKGVELTNNQVNYVVELIMAWINREYKRK